MKRKLLSMALALALCLGLAVPALAEEEHWWEYEGDNFYTNLLHTDSMVMGKQTFKLRGWEFEEGEDGMYTATRGDEIEEWAANPIKFPRGAEALFRDGLASTLVAFSDPDGDGVYDQRLLRVYFVEKDGISYEMLAAVPVTETSVAEDDDNMYDGSCIINGGVNSMSTIEVSDGCVKLTADYLTDMFGANTLIEVLVSPEVKENWAFTFMLTGETLAPEDTEALTYTVTEENGEVVSKWAEDLVEKARESGLLPYCVRDARYENDNYDYTRPITRAQFAEAAVRLYAAMQGKSAYDLGVSSSTPFTDATNDYVGYAYNLGFVTGTGATTFSPDATLTREQAAVMLSQVYAKQHEAIPQVGSTGFSDDGSVSSWAKSAVAFASSKGIVSGVGDDQFAPQRSIAIQEAAVMTLRMLENLK